MRKISKGFICIFMEKSLYIFVHYKFLFSNCAKRSQLYIATIYINIKKTKHDLLIFSVIALSFLSNMFFRCLHGTLFSYFIVFHTAELKINVTSDFTVLFILVHTDIYILLLFSHIQYFFFFLVNSHIQYICSIRGKKLY